jgi:hypothetical protein
MFTMTQRMRSIFLVVLGAVFFVGPWALADDSTLESAPVITPDPGDPTRDPPVLVISFHDPIAYHCMGITSDGSYYYTINGGNASWGEIRTYDLSGDPVHTVTCAIDARSIHYNPADGLLYAKGYDRNWYEVDPQTGAFSVAHATMFQFSQSSGALTPDGDYIMEHEGGTMHWYDAVTGAWVDTMTGFYYGSSPSHFSMATDGARLFTWDGTLTYVYDMEGTFIESWEIPQGHYGFSLSFANGLIFTSNDDTDMWYGYDVGGGPTPPESQTWGAIKSLYR